MALDAPVEILQAFQAQFYGQILAAELMPALGVQRCAGWQDSRHAF